MFYRRKIILSLFQLCNGQIEKTRLQKLLFLYTQRKLEAEYDFVPYKYGCYSYSANADVVTMVKNSIYLNQKKDIPRLTLKTTSQLLKERTKIY